MQFRTAEEALTYQYQNPSLTLYYLTEPVEFKWIVGTDRPAGAEIAKAGQSPAPITRKETNP